MNIIVCIDDNQGMLFNKRRQSRDVKVLEDIATLTDTLWISSFSEKLFENVSETVRFKLNIDDSFLNQTHDSGYCFVENEKILPYEKNIEQLIIYKWNRKYPSDFKLDLNLEEWKLVESVDFVGNSHNKITREIYEK